MRILAVSGSHRSSATIGGLVHAVVRLAPGEVEVTIHDGLHDLPHFAPILDGDDAPAPVAHLRGLLREADGVVICTPEYAYGMPGTLKNALDWAVSSGEFVGKPVAAISASPYETGGERARASLLLTLTALNAAITEGAALSVPHVRTRIDAEGNVSDAETAYALRAVLDALMRAVQARRDNTE